MNHYVQNVNHTSHIVDFPKERATRRQQGETKPKQEKEPRFMWKDEILQKSDLSSNARLLALVMMDFFGEVARDVAWPGVALFSKRCRLSERSVQRALREMETAGFIRNERPGGGLKRTGRYRLQFPLSVVNGDSLTP